MCAEKFSVVRKFMFSDKTVLTGCTGMPHPSSPFCSEDSKSETPVLLAGCISEKTRNALREHRKKGQTSHYKLPNDSVYTVESILNARVLKDTTEFLVKFSGFSEKQACWEPSDNLPSFIVEL